MNKGIESYITKTMLKNNKIQEINLIEKVKYNMTSYESWF